MAFTRLLQGTCARCYGIEIDANRVEQARSLGIEVLQADALEVRCPTEVLSLLYLNPPYDFETGQTNNQRLEFVFLEHTYRWLKPGGVLVLVIPQPQLRVCARILSEHFTDLSVYRLTDPASVQYQQVAVFGVRRKRHQHLRDSALLDSVRWLEMLASKADLETLTEASGIRYEVPDSGAVTLTHAGIPLDEVEDLLPDSAAYRQASRILLPKQRDVRGRPLTPLHGGHVGLLCTAGMLNGVFGEGEDRHIAHWRSVKFTDHWEEEEEDGTKILHDRERFSHELTLVFANGKTQILTHEKKERGMKNAHLRFGWLTYVKSTEKTTTSIKLRLDRFIGEVLPDPPRQARAHLISVIGGDTQISAVSAAISMGDRFMVEGPDIQPTRICLERNAQCFKGSIQLAGRKKPLRHLIGMSEEFASGNMSAGSGRTLLAGSDKRFVWASIAHIYGIPGIPEWADWFADELKTHHALIHALGIGCDPVIVKGEKEQFLEWLRWGVESSAIRFSTQTGSIRWPAVSLDDVFPQVE